MADETDITVLKAQVGVDDPDGIRNNGEYHTLIETKLNAIQSHIVELLGNAGEELEEIVFPVVTALKESSVNAFLHGNLGISSEVRDSTDAYRKAMGEYHPERYTRTVDIRIVASCEDGTEEVLLQDLIREAKIVNEETGEETKATSVSFKGIEELPKGVRSLIFQITDHGVGFTPDRWLQEEEPEDDDEEVDLDALELKASGNGIKMMRTFMDQVTYNATGNSVTMTKHIPKS